MSRKIALAFLSGASALAVATCGSVAQAQQAGGSPTPKADASRATVGDEVIVTATRRAERIHDVPGAVSAVSGQTLQDFKANGLADFAAFTPGVSFSSPSPSTNLVVIRGITTGAQLNSAIGLYLDDVPIGSSTPFGAGAQALNIGLFDLQRVEVLSGPQGTLFGANALGGTLRYITQNPNLNRFSGLIEAEGDSTAHGGPGGAIRAEVNAPLSDKVALRVVGVDQEDSGYVNDPTHGRQNQGDARTLLGRASLLFEVSPKLDFQLNGFADHVQSNGVDQVLRDLTTHAPVGGVYNASFALAQPSNAEVYMGSGVIHWDLDWAKFTSITAYQEAGNHSQSDLSTAYSGLLSLFVGPAGVNPYNLLVDVTTKRFTQEVRLQSQDNRGFEWVTGAFYSDETTYQTDNIQNEASPGGLLLGSPVGEFFLPSTAKTFALFGNATVHITSTLDTTVGVRQTWDDVVFSSSGIGDVPKVFFQPLVPVTGRGTSQQSVQTYLFDLRYRPTDATMIYGRISSGYRPGGPNLSTSAGTANQTFAADKVWNYEVGLKQTLSDRGSLNISAYHIDWTDIQQVHNIGGVNQLVNAGDARVNGADGTLSYRLLQPLTVLATASYTDAALTTPALILGLANPGAPIPIAPKFSAAVAASYSFDPTDSVHGVFNLSVRYIGQRNSSYPGGATPNYVLPAYTTVDATMNLTSKDGWEVTPYVKNIFDVRGEVAASTIANVFAGPGAPVPVTLSQPRTIGLSVGRHF